MDALKRLEAAAAYRLVLLAAPAGSGKTALLQRWATQLRAGNARVAWLDLEAADNEASRFLQDLSMALSRIGDGRLAISDWGSGKSTFSPIGFARVDREVGAGRERPHPESEPDGYAQATQESKARLLEAMAGLINALADGGQEDYFLVLDSYQRITSTAVHEAVQLLLDYPPPCMHIVLATRSMPPLQIARLRVRRQLLEIGPEDLTAAILRSAAGRR